MMSVLCVAIFWVVNASSGEKSCLQFSIPTGSGAGGKGGVSHRLKARLSRTFLNSMVLPLLQPVICNCVEPPLKAR